MQRYEPALNGTAFMGMVEIEQGRYTLYSEAQAEIEAERKEKIAVVKRCDESLKEYYRKVGELEAEIDRLTKENKILTLKCATSLANNLCPDHRDKQAGKPCLACEIEALTAERDRLKKSLENIANDDMAVCDSCDAYQETARAALGGGGHERT